MQIPAIVLANASAIDFTSVDDVTASGTAIKAQRMGEKKVKSKQGQERRGSLLLCEIPQFASNVAIFSHGHKFPDLRLFDSRPLPPNPRHSISLTDSKNAMYCRFDKGIITTHRHLFHFDEHQICTRLRRRTKRGAIGRN